MIHTKRYFIPGYAAARRAKKMTNVEVAKALGITSCTLANWEYNKCRADLENIKRLAELLDTTVSFLTAMPAEPVTMPFSADRPRIAVEESPAENRADEETDRKSGGLSFFAVFAGTIIGHLAYDLAGYIAGLL